ncbi:hypothetical protein [Streptomyces longispororuber]|uniref:hypothetical protein n=1 Tax=Streptomyces longispororuber TaxID=68230 RepID=UPI00370163E5
MTEPHFPAPSPERVSPRNRRKVFAVVVLLFMTSAAAACGTPDEGGGGTGVRAERGTMNEQEAVRRAEEIVHQAVDGMAPEPTLRSLGPEAVGACVARDDHGPDDRLQVSLTYQLVGVPGADAGKLVRQAQDAWVEQGYAYQSSDPDGSDPFPSVTMRSTSDEFWMEALTGVVHRAKGKGVAVISVTSPCFERPTGGSGDQAATSYV